MPSFSEVLGVIVIFIVLSIASGHGDGVWKTMAEVRRVAISNARQDWGCPLLFAGRAAGTSYRSLRYR